MMRTDMNLGNGKPDISIESTGAMLKLRCQSPRCFKLLGMVDKAMHVHIEKPSSRGWWIYVELERGTIKCKRCGTELFWDAGKLKTDKGE